MAGTVTVANKVPNGLILRVGEIVERRVPMMGGGYDTVKEWRPVGESVTIYGPGRAIGEDAKAPTSGGYALTHGVDADFFAKWLADNAGHPAVENGLIFAHEKPDAVTRMSVEKAKIKSGLEPISPDSDMRVPRQVKTDDGKGK